MKRFRWEILLGLSLIILSALFYYIHFLIFKDAHHIFIYLLGDVAFVPVEVLLVTLIIHKLLDHRERRHKLEKLNMVIEVFFSEMGTKTLTYFSDFDPDLDDIRGSLIMSTEWSEKEFLKVSNKLKKYDYKVDIKKITLSDLRSYLVSKRDFLLRMLENPVLLEHESFTNLLRAIFHLTEELSNRKYFDELPESDLHHLSGDIKRAYGLLVNEWVEYMKYLKMNYPYLFSLAIRTNPFDQQASPIVH